MKEITRDFMISLQPQSIVDAKSQCFEYLGFITLGRAGTFRAWKVYQGKKLDSLDKIRLSF